MNKKILSVREYKIHGIKDSRWTIKDKIYQYKGAIKLYAIEAARQRKKLSKEIKILRDEIREYREILKEVKSGDRRRMHQVLQNDKNLQLAYQDRDPTVVYGAINQDFSLRRKQLDELLYFKKIKIKEFFDLKVLINNLEWTFLMNEYEEQNRLREPDRHQQKLAALYQKYVANRNYAESIRTTYLAMVKILKKDTVYFNAIIEALKEDKMEQCKVLLRGIFMGQLAAEELDDTREKYKRMARDVWKNMKERERTLNIVRSRVDDLRSDIRELVQVESNPELMAMTRKLRDDDDGLEENIKILEETFNKVKEILMARSYDELFDRFEEQARQKKRLLKKLENNLKERELLLNKKNCATLILADLNNSLISASGEYDKYYNRYKTDKREMLEEIKTSKKREKDFVKLEKSRSELLINVKCGLQNMLAMMIFVKPGLGGKKSPREKKRDKRKTSDLSDGKSSSRKPKSQFIDNAEYQLEKFDSDGKIVVLTLLNQVTKKANILFGLSNFEMTQEDEEKAKNLYQSYVAEKRSKIYQNNHAAEQKVMTVEHVCVDSSVMSRTDVKNQSKNIIEMYSRAD
ncbi:uncharacterized protein LOC103574011 [Microplitis demolitor]|uniref:uncharacterized protein LOC103574011 n=1 Tax=Microplitis demolitor TaxID=69319 RepID=UPI00235B6AFE|nr:uncharacterized protein LOC103574011 [Microplitis demolitor]